MLQTLVVRFSCACLALALVSFARADRAVVARSEWVHADAAGHLVYKADAQDNRIPDFSNVGYHGGGVALPDVAARVTVDPAAGDATERIQAAIDEVEKLPADEHGHRGAVLLRKGRYPIAGTLRIRTGGVVLRGEGDGESGTVLIATGAKQRSLIVAGHGNGRAPSDEDAPAEASPSVPQHHERLNVIDDYVPVGAHVLHLDRVTGLTVGAAVLVRRPSTAEWIHDIAMDRIPPAADHRRVVQWAPGTKDLVFYRRIVAIVGNAITLDAPIVNALEKKYGGAEVLVGSDDPTIAEIGIENLRGDSEFKSPTDEKHGWILVDYSGVRDSWVRGVTAIHFGYSCVNVGKASRSITVDHCVCLDPISIITGGRRYSFAVDGQLTLVEHCYARNGRHDFVMHALAAGPDVFFDCLAEEVHADSGPHHRWSAGVLYDNVAVLPPKDPSQRHRGDAGINIRDRGNMGSGHGWAGANQVVWNSRAAEMIIQQPPTAQNWAIGCLAAQHSGNGYWESFGHPVQPQSLYLAQLQDRLHAAPGAGVTP